MTDHDGAVDSPATTAAQDVCPHCGHGWSGHTDRSRCHCGCMWQPTPPTPTPPTAQDLLIARIEDVIWRALEEQDGPYVDREMDMVDASGAGLNMTAVATAVIQALGLTPEWTVESKCGAEEHNTSGFYATPAKIAAWRNRNGIRTKVMRRLVGPWQEQP